MAEAEEFELIPISPLRRLERRLEKMESTKGVDVKEFFNQLVDIVRMNQQLVDELAKANDAMRIEISKLPGRLDDLINNLNELISFIKASAGADAGQAAAGGASLEPLLKKMDALIEGNKKIAQSNEAVLSSVDQLFMKMKKPGVGVGRRMPRRRLPPLRKKLE
jgi:hypothetical protein